MTSFADLNTYSSTTINYTIPEQQISLGNATASFNSPYLTWNLVRTLGPLTGNGVSITYDVSSSTGATIAFNSTSFSNNTLTTTNPSTGVYTVSGILDIIDYISAEATITPDALNTANISYDAVYENDNAVGNITVDYLGVV